MSKFVKDLITERPASSGWTASSDAAPGQCGRPDATTRTSACGSELRQKNIKLLVIKNSLARRATEGTRLAPAFEGSEGTLAVVWGGETSSRWPRKSCGLPGDKEFEPFAARGGVMDGAKLAAEEVTAGQQVAQPRGAAQHCCGARFSRPVRKLVEPIDQRRRRAWPARSSRRAKETRKQPQRGRGRRRRREQRRSGGEHGSDRTQDSRAPEIVSEHRTIDRPSPTRVVQRVACRPSEKGKNERWRLMCNHGILRRRQEAGRQDRRPDAEGGQGTERLSRRSPRHRAGRGRRGDDGRRAGGGGGGAAARKRRPSSTSCSKASATRRSA